TFAAASLDCFVCHGQIPEQHTTQPALAHFSKKNREPARVVASICGQCHLRTGSSKSTDLPYPNNFVAGDNLFRDFHVDFSTAVDTSQRKSRDRDRQALRPLQSLDAAPANWNRQLIGEALN